MILLYIGHFLYTTKCKKRKFSQEIHKRNKYERLHQILHKHLTQTHRNKSPF